MLKKNNGLSTQNSISWGAIPCTWEQVSLGTSKLNKVKWVFILYDLLGNWVLQKGHHIITFASFQGFFLSFLYSINHLFTDCLRGFVLLVKHFWKYETPGMRFDIICSSCLCSWYLRMEWFCICNNENVNEVLLTLHFLSSNGTVLGLNGFGLLPGEVFSSRVK